MKRFFKLGLTGLALVLLAGSAHAFEQTTVSKVPGKAPAGSTALTAPEQLLKGLGEKLDTGGAPALVDPSASSSEQGTDIWIPGLGVVGKMPKVNFGLELLYGDKNQPELSDESAFELLDDELTIKGTLKHRF